MQNFITAVTPELHYNSYYRGGDSESADPYLATQTPEED